MAENGETSGDETLIRPAAFSPLLAAAALFAAMPGPAESIQPAPAAAVTYADLADLALAAPVAAHVRVARALPVESKRAAGLKPGFARLYVEADVVSLLRAPTELPARLAYVVDLPRAPKGGAPKLRKGTQFLLLGAPVAGRPGELRLIAPDAQLAFDTATAARLRTIVRDLAAAAAPPRVTGISRAFHVPGAIRGESETQIFLDTATGAPISLNVLRRPGQTPQWAAATGEIVDESAGAAQRDTLLWYRLACGLPRRLPAAALADAEPSGRSAIEADYRFVLDQLGPCTRQRRPV
jgi:hypothetical protein